VAAGAAAAGRGAEQNYSVGTESSGRQQKMQQARQATQTQQPVYEEERHMLHIRSSFSFLKRETETSGQVMQKGSEERGGEKREKIKAVRVLPFSSPDFIEREDRSPQGNSTGERGASCRQCSPM